MRPIILDVVIAPPNPEREAAALGALVRFMAKSLPVWAAKKGIALQTALSPEEYARRHKAIVDWIMAHPEATSVPPELAAGKPAPSDANTSAAHADQPKGS